MICFVVVIVDTRLVYILMESSMEKSRVCVVVVQTRGCVIYTIAGTGRFDHKTKAEEN